MSEGKYIEQVYRELCALDEEKVAKAGPLPVLEALANQVAYRHPVWYERFRIKAKIVGAWRWLKK